MEDKRSIIQSKDLHLRDEIMNNEKIKYVWRKGKNVLHEKHCWYASLIPSDELDYSEEIMENMPCCFHCWLQVYLLYGAKDPYAYKKYEMFFQKANISKEQVRKIYIMDDIKTFLLPAALLLSCKDDMWKITIAANEGHIHLYQMVQEEEWERKSAKRILENTTSDIAIRYIEKYSRFYDASIEDTLPVKSLFLDIEWAKITHKEKMIEEMIELSGTMVDENGIKIHSKLSYMKPEHLCFMQNRTLSLLQLRRKTLEKCKTSNKVLSEFFDEFPGFINLVLWNSNAYEILKQESKKYNIKIPSHRVIFIQDILDDLSGRKISFEKALAEFDIIYDVNKLHRSDYDVKYLIELYAALRNVLKETQKKRNRQLYHSINSNIVHYLEEYCYSGKRIDIEKIKFIDHHELAEGYRMCRICKEKDDPYIRIGKKKNQKNDCKKRFDNIPVEKQFDDEVIEKICNHYQLSCSISYGVVFIRSNISSWRIYHDYERVTSVMHENMWQNNLEKNKYNYGFHQQNIEYEKMTDIIRYIAYHDKDLIKRITNQERAYDYKSSLKKISMKNCKMSLS